MEESMEFTVQEACEALLIAQSKLRDVRIAEKNKRQQWVIEMALEDITVHLRRLTEEFPKEQP